MCGSGATVLSVGWGLLPLPIVLAAFSWWARHRWARHRLLVGLVFVVYLDVLLSLTFFPLPLPPYDVITGCPFIYAEPFHTIGGALAAGVGSYRIGVLIGNLAAFVPVGLLLPLLRPGDRRPWLSVLAGGFVLSVAIETGQLIGSLIVGYPYRQADVDDVIANTTGAGIGYLLLLATATTYRALAATSRKE